MKKSGFSLIELIVAIAVSAIVCLALTVHFVAEYKFRSMMLDRIQITREARIAINHAARILRFARPDTVVVEPEKISATIKGNYLAFITDDTPVAYERVAGDILEYTQDVTTQDIAKHIANFAPAWNGKEIELSLTAQKANYAITLQTRIRALGD